MIADVAHVKPNTSDGVFIIDVITIHKGTCWHPKRNVMLGGLLMAQVFQKLRMISQLRQWCSWSVVLQVIGSTKLHILQNKISASVQAQLIKEYTSCWPQENLCVIALVFDSAYSNQGTATQLGCKMEISNIQTWFLIHRFPAHRYIIIFDIVLYDKIDKKTFGQQKTLCHEENGKLHRINCQYIEALKPI